MNTQTSFMFHGARGTVDAFNFVQWGGMGFQIEAAAPDLRKTIDNARRWKACKLATRALRATK